MSVRAYRLVALFLPTVSLALAGAGCCSQTHTHHASKSLWESPIIHETRALLVVPDEELHVLRIDDCKDVQASRQIKGQPREYFVCAGEHCVSASFRYAEPMRGGLIGEVRGLPLTLRHRFVAGHKYAALYHQYVLAPGPEPRWLIEALAAEFVPPQREYWSLEIIDLTETPKETGK